MYSRTTIITTTLVILCVLVGGWAWWNTTTKDTQTKAQKQLANATSSVQTEDMMVAGGCFWCVEADLQKAPGVIEVISGYSGGDTKNPTYETYAEGGHREVVRVIYDPTTVTYEGLLYYFIKHIDPTDGKGSFVDRGEEYSPAIYYETQKEKEIAQSVLDDISNRGVFNEDLAVPIRKQKRFWRAEEYHQDYSKKNPVRYQIYRRYSGRDAFIKKHWGQAADTIPEDIEPQSRSQTATTSAFWRTYERPAPKTLEEKLSDMEYRVIVDDGTEPAFENAYWDNGEAGIYVDKLSGEPLFSSKNKYESGTGWPSFTKPLAPENIVLKADYSLGVRRTEVRSKHGNAHLGHVFGDGPTTQVQAGSAAPTGLRYCLNSAALEFIPADELEQRGYGAYTYLFE